SIWSRFFPLMEFIGDFCAVVLLAYGGFLVINDQLALGELVAFFSLVWYIMGPLMNLGFVVNQFSQAKASGERLIEILDAEEDVAEMKDAVSEPIKGHVTFKDATLTYTKNDDHAYKYITHDAPHGTTLTLIE